MGNELMTPVINAGANPLSLTSVASMEDMGYLVNYAVADLLTFNYPPPQQAARAGGDIGRVALTHDALPLPLYTVSSTGSLKFVRGAR